MLMGDQWLFERGMITERIVDTLLGYAYMQPGISNVVLEIDTDDPNMGKSPRLIYKLKLEKSLYKKYLKLKTLIENPSVFNKIRALFIMRSGTPSPGSIEQTIRMYASSIVPRAYTIDVLIEK